MEDGTVRSNEEGTPQGGPLSPLLSNIMLTDLDRELERRGYAFCKYADDCNIYVRSENAILRAQAAAEGKPREECCGQTLEAKIPGILLYQSTPNQDSSTCKEYQIDKGQGKGTLSCRAGNEPAYVYRNEAQPRAQRLGNLL